MDLSERIVRDPAVYHGVPCIRGTRIAVHQIVGMVANGDSIEDLLREYPSLQREDIQEALGFAAQVLQQVFDADPGD